MYYLQLGSRLFVSYSSFDDCFSSIDTIKHINECLWHVFKAVGVRLFNFDFALLLTISLLNIICQKEQKSNCIYLLNPLGHLRKSFHPTWCPSPHQKSFHFQLFENKSCFASGRHGWLLVIVSRNRSADRYTTKILHVVANCCTQQTANLERRINI